MTVRNELMMKWRTGGVLIRLVFVNVAVFLSLHLVGFICWIFKVAPLDLEIMPWLMGTSIGSLLIRTPWTIVTYMFTHYEARHILWNMVLLWFSGNLFAGLLGEKRMLGNYLLGGLTGFVAFFLSHNFLPDHLNMAGDVMILGASAAVMGVFIGIATYRPDMEVGLMFVGSVRLKYIALVLLILDLISIRQGSNSGGHIAHLGGALYGYIAARQLTKGNDWSLKLVQVFEAVGRAFKPRNGSRMTVAKHATTAAKPQARATSTPKVDKQAKVDVILDKISRSGYDSLSKEEKDFLFKASQ